MGVTNRAIASKWELFRPFWVALTNSVCQCFLFPISVCIQTGTDKPCPDGIAKLQILV
ncbi:MAG: hypothetical protein JETT_1959 [Candidatus Jettenia ecosi]|uniref:Uncharacterized protein n=1 Tax=Candidatus Jettenia ecosi TaxID=2494326 RepID=A0A533QAS5_9BACT|nr:MAG: hypothetical protein JETT_1959 [Candidatus Jettenia ecosi]